MIFPPAFALRNDARETRITLEVEVKRKSGAVLRSCVRMGVTVEIDVCNEPRQESPQFRYFSTAESVARARAVD